MTKETAFAPRKQSTSQSGNNSSVKEKNRWNETIMKRIDLAKKPKPHPHK